MGVSGYIVTRSATAPLASATGWSTAAPTTYTVTANGTYTLYPWAKDAAGNVSPLFASPVSVKVASKIDFTFETDSSAWTTTQTSPATWLLHGTGTGVGGPYTGTYGYGITNNASGYAFSDAITVVANSTYDVSAWVRGELDDQQGLGLWYVRAYFYNSSATQVGVVNVSYGGETSISTTWKQVAATVTAPAGAVSMKIMLLNQQTSGWVAFDDISAIKTGATANLVTNPGFETTGNWTTTTTAPGTWFLRGGSGDAAPHSGTYGYAITNNVYGYLTSAAITATPSTQYNVSAWLRGELDDALGQGGWLVRATFYNSSNTQISYTNIASGSGSTLTTVWAQSSGTVTTPVGTTSLKIQLYNQQASGWVAFDDISVIKVGTTANLVTNPGFESTGTWTATQTSPGAWLWRSTTGTEGGPHTGTYGYVITNNVYGSLTSVSVGAAAGTTYSISAWIRGELVDNQGTQGWIVRAIFYNSSNTQIGYTNIASGAGASVTSTWKQVSGSAIAPAGTATMRIVLLNYQTSGWVDFDDVSITH